MQVHVHSHALTAPVWTMTESVPDRPISYRPVVIDASIRGIPALGYEREPRTGSPADSPCDAASSTNMIENSLIH